MAKDKKPTKKKKPNGLTIDDFLDKEDRMFDRRNQRKNVGGPSSTVILGTILERYDPDCRKGLQKNKEGAIKCQIPAHQAGVVMD